MNPFVIFIINMGLFFCKSFERKFLGILSEEDHDGRYRFHHKECNIFEVFIDVTCLLWRASIWVYFWWRDVGPQLFANNIFYGHVLTVLKLVILMLDSKDVPGSSEKNIIPLHLRESHKHHTITTIIFPFGGQSSNRKPC